MILNLIKSTFIFLILNALLSEICIIEASEMDPTDCEHLNKMINMVQNQVGQLSTCASGGNFGMTVALRTNKYLCIVKCGLIKVGILSAEGNVDVPGIMKFLDESIPPNFKDKAMEMMKTCQDAAGKIDPNDETCKSYEPLVSCILKGLGTNLRSVVSNTISSGRISPQKIAKCTGLAAKVEGELAKLDLQSLRRFSIGA